MGDRPRHPKNESTACPRGALIGRSAHGMYVIPARCKRWTCPPCGRINGKNLAGRIAGARVRRLLTLTVKPSTVDGPQDQLDEMHLAWRALHKLIVRRFGGVAVHYVRVVELTRQGVPHLHIALDCAYIPQGWLSLQWQRLTGSGVVDIRAVNTSKAIGRYLAKYVTKGGAAVPGRRKWSASLGFLPPASTVKHPDCAQVTSWYWSAESAETIYADAERRGFPRTGRLVLRPPPPEPEPPPRAAFVASPLAGHEKPFGLPKYA